MYKCLLWGTGKQFSCSTQVIKYYEQRQEIEIVGITSNEKIYSQILGWTFIPKHEISNYSIDIVIVMIEDPDINVFEEIYSKGFKYEDVIDIKVLKLPAFSFENYLWIKKDTPTIFSPMCWGGVTYHSLGLKFKSPFINMFLLEDDYMQFLDDPKSFIEHEISYKKTGWSEIMKKEYPIADCDGIELHFNHYNSFEEAKSSWDRRKKRINWDNILAMMFTDNLDVAERFLKMNYTKKMLFISFEMNAEEAIYLNLADYRDGIDLWTAVNDTAKGKYVNYDIFKMMKDGELSFLI
ncbi:MAG: DUF1919 domain-containing protein [Butyrivibrio sp.]|nr:DUF1919 domain-containing protein [Butyrivibrio sp.]